MPRFLPLLLLLPALATAAVVPLNQIAVVVDDGIILRSEIDKRVNDITYQFSKRRTALPPEDVLRKQVTEQLIIETLQMNLAERAGIRIEDSALNSALSEIAKESGVSLAQFQQQLDATPGSSYAEVREQVKREMMINRLRQRRMQDRIRITDQDVQNFLKSPAGLAEIATEYRLGHILIPIADSSTPEDIAKADAVMKKVQAELAAGRDFAQVAATYSGAETALKGGDLGWRKAAQLPSIFGDIVGQLEKGEVASPLRTPGGLHLVKLLDRRGADEVKVKQRQVRHILIKPTEILSIEEARQKLEDIRSRIAAGAMFADEARIHSEDPGSARQGGDLGWVSSGEMVPEFERTMLTTPLQTLSGVFQSSYGWHILEVQGER
ncbi:MAG: peptidylprolyl isomerase, partial [Moraxellaceae bacterium]|nr:peptidylprolyl isomerase [Moraxellaceae bacterium]